MQELPDLEDIRRALQDRVASSVSEMTGVNRNLVADIKSGKQKTASKTTLITLARHLNIAGRFDD